MVFCYGSTIGVHVVSDWTGSKSPGNLSWVTQLVSSRVSSVMACVILSLSTGRSLRVKSLLLAGTLVWWPFVSSITHAQPLGLPQWSWTQFPWMLPPESCPVWGGVTITLFSSKVLQGPCMGLNSLLFCISPESLLSPHDLLRDHVAHSLL